MESINVCSTLFNWQLKSDLLRSWFCKYFPSWSTVRLKNLAVVACTFTSCGFLDPLCLHSNNVNNNKKNTNSVLASNFSRLDKKICLKFQKRSHWLFNLWNIHSLELRPHIEVTLITMAPLFWTYVAWLSKSTYCRGPRISFDHEEPMPRVQQVNLNRLEYTQHMQANDIFACNYGRIECYNIVFRYFHRRALETRQLHRS